ncbi:SH3 domain-containing protein [Geomonas sp. Red32]|uniref:SH3 domain-containing protein n=1 Tax=Geomonas sp. Red32 TaxID=2912856 RepID=UPI00202CF9ED|nr:SH3 domain-containing protein [Geomonas sp. Red32]MCM0081311.1 SH3 domain-containing protein [Geomonas sp. Red32]
MRRPLPVAILLAVLLAAPALGALWPQRPFAGCGVLVVAEAPEGGAADIVMYVEPGVGRMVETRSDRLPRLAGSESEPVLAVMARRGGWVQLAYDDAGRTGWVEKRRSWKFLEWPEYLAGRELQMLSGVRKADQAVKGAPSGEALVLGSVPPLQPVRVLKAEGPWALLDSPSGWIKWRDRDGRLIIGTPEGDELEKR